MNSGQRKLRAEAPTEVSFQGTVVQICSVSGKLTILLRMFDIYFFDKSQCNVRKVVGT